MYRSTNVYYITSPPPPPPPTHTHMPKNDEPPPLEELSSDSVAPQPQSNQPNQSDTETTDFPIDHLTKLDDQLNRPKWVVPVRPDDDLERLLRAAIKLCREGTCMGLNVYQ